MGLFAFSSEFPGQSCSTKVNYVYSTQLEGEMLHINILPCRQILLAICRAVASHSWCPLSQIRAFLVIWLWKIKAYDDKM